MLLFHAAEVRLAENCLSFGYSNQIASGICRAQDEGSFIE